MHVCIYFSIHDYVSLTLYLDPHLREVFLLYFKEYLIYANVQPLTATQADERIHSEVEVTSKPSSVFFTIVTRGGGGG